MRGADLAVQVLQVVSPVLIAALTWVAARLSQYINARVKNEYLRAALDAGGSPSSHGVSGAMDAYVFQAALYCEACGERLKEDLDTRGVEDSGDSDDYPQGPYPEGGGESDSPQHCDSGEECATAERLGRRAVGAFLENPLTDEGRAYVEQAVAENPESEAVKRWADFYEIEPAT